LAMTVNEMSQWRSLTAGFAMCLFDK
jgi:hypothetical protein